MTDRAPPSSPFHYWPNAQPPRAQPLRTTRTLSAEAAGLIFTVDAAYPGQDVLRIAQPEGMRVSIPLPPGAALTLHALLTEALGLKPALREGGE